MVSVAKNFDAPIKLLFPRSLEPLGAPPGPAAGAAAAADAAWLAC
jgi:hypothetical protein